MAKFQAPDLGNATPEFLIDEMGKLSILENYVKKLRNVYKEAFLARVGIDVEEMLNGEEKTNTGDLFVASTSRSDPQRINVKRLQEEDPDTAAKYLEQKAQLTTRFRLREGVVNPVVNDLLEQMKRELDLE